MSALTNSIKKYTRQRLVKFSDSCRLEGIELPPGDSPETHTGTSDEQLEQELALALAKHSKPLDKETKNYSDDPGVKPIDHHPI